MPLKRNRVGILEVTPCPTHRAQEIADPWCLRCYPTGVKRVELRRMRIVHVPGQMKLPLEGLA